MSTTGGLRGLTGVAIFAAAALLALHLVCGDGYGYFRDELYYLACADHLAWGYVDQPPLSILILKLWRGAFGDSILALRLLPALAGMTALLLCLAMVRRLRGGLAAAALAAAAFLLAPIYLAMFGYYSMNAFDILAWTLAEYLLVRILQTPLEQPATALWLSLGLVLGLGLQNKIGVLWLGAGLLAGLLASDHRRRLMRWPPYLAAGLAVLLFLPYVIWNSQNGFPILEFIRNASTQKYVAQPPLKFLGGVALLMNPAAAPIWLTGIIATFAWRDARRYLPFGVLFVCVLAILLLNGTSKPEYLAPIFPIFLALGGVAIEHVARPHRWIAPGYAAVVAVAGVIIAPLALPVLPIERFIAYSAALGFGPQATERKRMGVLPQFYADRFGWPELAEAMAKVYAQLPEADRARAVIVVDNYGEAAAIDFFGRRYGLPPARSQHNNYYLWGYGGGDLSVAIILRRDGQALNKEFDSVEQVGDFSAPYVMPYEDHLPIFVCRGFHGDIRKAWVGGKNFN